MKYEFESQLAGLVTVSKEDKEPIKTVPVGTLANNEEARRKEISNNVKS